MFLKYFNFYYFFVSFAIGVFYIYLTNEHKKVIVIYPNPTNLEKYTYVDKSNNCFHYKLHETSCPKDKTIYKDIKVEY